MLPGAKARILVVDDDEGGRYPLARCLRNAGYEVLETGSGKECLKLVRAGQVDVVLLDVGLPDISGIEVCRTLKEDPESALVPVLQMSARFTTEMDRFAGFESGADGYIVSPYESREVLARVEGVLRTVNAERRLRRTVELNPQSPWTATSAGQIEDISERSMKAAGLARDEILGYGWAEAIHREDLPKTRKAWLRSVRTGQPYGVEHRIRRGDGTYRWMRSRAYPDYVPGGGVARWYGFTEDIDDQVRFRLDLQRAHDREHLLARTISTLLTSTEPQKVVQDLCEEVRVFLNCAVFFNFLLNADTQRLQLNACGGVDPRLARKVEGLELEQSLCGSAAMGACRMVAENIGSSDDSRAALVKGLGLSAYACHPLLAPEGEVLGTLSFGARNRGSFSREDLELMKTVAGHVSAAMLRRRSEGQLRQSEERLRLATSATNLGTWDYNLLSGELTWDARCRQIFGLGPDAKVSFQTFFDGVHPEDRERALSLVQPSLPPGVEPLDLEYRIVGLQDGQVRWVRVTRKMVLNGSGEPGRFIGTVEEITERKRSEEALRESEQRFRTMSDGLPLIIWVHNAQGHQEFVNRTFLEYFGLKTGELSNEKWRELMDPDTAAPYAEEFRLALGERRPFHAETRVRRADGEWRWIESFGQPRWSGSGEFLGVVGASVDITERKQAEEVLARDRNELEQLVTDRTAKLQELVRELEHFSYSITHDLRSPLRAMRSFAELVSDPSGECSEEERQSLLRRIVTAAERMDMLITDALRYSQLVRQELVLAPVDVSPLLQGMLDTYPNLGQDRANIKLQGPFPVVMGSAAGLTQCFSNLLENAVKFTKPGQKPSVRVWAEERDETWIRFWVEDDGLGIERAMLPRVFDMFVKGSTSVAGTGIGLALVRKVMERMNGRLGVDSEEGQGARFWLELRSYRAPLSH